MPAGRPSSYDPKILPRVAEMALAGYTDNEIAEVLGIDRVTLYRWKHQFPELRNSLKEDKDTCDKRIERTLFQKALDGDVTSMIFWLKNRKSQDWRDKQLHGFDEEQPLIVRHIGKE